jgi:carbamoyl-phosphate synthase large subunit
MIRPSFVLGGRGMEVIYDESMLREYGPKAVGVTPDRRFSLIGFSGTPSSARPMPFPTGNMFHSGVMEHVELAGVHSGLRVRDPAGVHREEHLETIKRYTRQIAEALHVCG